MTVLFLASELLNNIRAFSRILADVEIYIVPLVNPDGYEYTHTHVSLIVMYLIDRCTVKSFTGSFLAKKSTSIL